MLVLPTQFKTDMTAGTATRPLMLYELQLAAGTLRYSSQAVTWGGNAYTALATKSSSIKRSMELKPATFSVTFSNVTNTLRSQIEPIDLMSGQRIVCRFIMKDGTDTPYVDSIVPFVGIMRKPRKVDESTFEITAVSIEAGWKRTIPGRQFSPSCMVTEFAGGVDCNYVGVLSTCDRNFDGGGAGCQGRSREHEFLGFRGAPLDLTQQFLDVFGSGQLGNPQQNFEGILDSDGRPLIGIWGYSDALNRVRALFANKLTIGDPTTVVPLLYGRRTIGGVTIEEVHGDQPNFTASDFNITFYALCEGEIDEVVNWIVSGQAVDDEYAAGDSGDCLVVGIRWRPGTLGLVGQDASTTQDDGQPREVTQTTSQLSQFTEAAYSRTAYVIVVQGPDSDDFQPVTDSEFDTKGKLLQKYTAAATPTTDGSPEWSANPIWEVVDGWLATRYGLGNVISDTDIDFEASQPSALLCDPYLLFSTEADTTVDDTAVDNGDGTFTVPVANISGFIIGRIVRLNNDSGTDSEIRSMEIDSVTIDDPGVSITIGWRVQQVLRRWECHIAFTSSERPIDWLKKILETCTGYVTHSEEGKLQLRIEQTEPTSRGHYKDFSASAGYGMKKGSFKWLPNQDDEEDINRVEVSFVNEARGFLGGGDVETATDWDGVAAHGFKTKRLQFDGVSSREQASKLAQYHLDKAVTLGAGASIIAEPVAMELQPGDKITITHDVPNWTAQDKRVVETELFGLGSDDEFMVRVEVEDYDGTIYPDTIRAIDQRAQPGIPAITLTAVSVDVKARLSWSLTAGTRTSVRMFEVYKKSSTFAGVAHPRYRIATLDPRFHEYTHQFTEAEYGTTWYFLVRARIEVGAVNSNEVTAVPVRVTEVGTTSLQRTSGTNKVYGGDKFDATVWQTIAGAPTLNGNTATLNAAVDEVGRHFPGLAPPFVATGPALLSGGGYMVRVAIKNAASGTQNGAVEVYIEDTGTTTEWIALTIAAADIVDTWRHYAFEFNPGSDVTGTPQIRVRYQAGGALGAIVGQLMIHESTKVLAFGLSLQELLDGQAISTAVDPPNAAGFTRAGAGTYFTAETT